MHSADLTVPVTNDVHLAGALDAVLTLVMYGDYECPYTAMARELILELQDALGERLCFVYRNFPLWDIHPHALHAAIAAEAAGAEGKFWEMHHQLFTHQDYLDDASLLRHAAAVGLDATRFAAALRAPEHAERVQADLRGGEASGVHSTPTFFLNGHRHREKFNLQALVQEIFDIPGVDPSRD
jgi:protein-disulfide isomerase